MAKRDFRDKTVVITGAASGIGLAVARRFARAGAHLGLLDMDARALDKSADQLDRMGTQILPVACNVTDPVACQSAMDQIIQRFGGLDLLFNNAGITQRGSFVKTDIAVFRKVMEVNFFGSLYCTKAAISSLIERRGMIISNQSIAGVAPLFGRTGYSASKHAMHGLFASLQAEVRSAGVHVMIVCPGFIKTNLQTRALGANGQVTTRPQSHIGRHDTPEHAAQAIFKGACREKQMLVLTAVGKLGYLLSRFAPRIYERQMVKRLQSELTGD